MDENRENILSDLEQPERLVEASFTESVNDSPTLTVSPDTKPRAEDVIQAPRKRILQGVVVSNKPNKTIVVKFERQVAHPLYKKYYKQSKKVLAHDENNECNIGDTVRIKENRPLSARKRWHLIEIVQRAK